MRLECNDKWFKMLKNTENISIGNIHLGIGLEQDRDSIKRVWKPPNLILIYYLFRELSTEGVLKKVL